MISAVLEHPLIRTDAMEIIANLPDRDASGDLSSYDLFRFHCLLEKRNPFIAEPADLSGRAFSNLGCNYSGQLVP